MTIWMWDDPTSGFHDHQCPCAGHCHNCFTPLTGRQRKYCSTGCARQWRAEVQFDRHMSGGRAS